MMMMMMMIGPNYVRPAEASNLRNGGSALCSKLSLDLFRFMDAFRRAKRKDTFKTFLRMWARRKVPQTLRPYLSPSILSVEDCEDLVPESQQENREASSVIENWRCLKNDFNRTVVFHGQVKPYCHHLTLRQNEA